MKCFRHIPLLFMATIAMLSCRYPIHHGQLMPGLQKDKDTYEKIRKGLAVETVPASSGRNAEETSRNIREGGLEIPLMRGKSREDILWRTGYALSYNATTRCPDWVAWHLVAGHTTGPYKRAGVKFHEDYEVPSPRAMNTDYMNSGYDRGHMCPSGDNKWSAQAQQDCFLFTNICPQNHQMNSGVWNDLEIQCRAWAEEYGDLYIVCGPVWISKKPKTIGKNKVCVPDGFYKAILCNTPPKKALGFYYPNSKGEGSIADHAMSVDELERLTGIDFFYRLDQKIQHRIEAHYDMDEWR